MIPAALLLALVPAGDPVAVHDVLLEVGDNPAVRLRLTIERNGKTLAALDAAAKRDRDSLRGKPGGAALDRLMPDGSLLRAEALAAASPHPAALSATIFKALDANSDGTLSADELAKTEQALLRKFDLDDDECVTPLELVPDLQTVVPARPAGAAVRVRLAPVEGNADLEQTVKLGRDAAYWRGKVGGVWMELLARSQHPGEKPVTPKALLAEGRDPAKAAFEKAAAGVVTLTAVPAPVGLFDLLDSDRDGQLSVPELRRARGMLAGFSPRETGVSLIIVPGVARSPAVPLVRTLAREGGPDWFRAMDKNGDGGVSAREFLGTPEQFRILDRDADGRVSAEEADKFGKP